MPAAPHRALIPLVERYGLKVRGCGPPVLPTTVRMTWLALPEAGVEPPGVVEQALRANSPASTAPAALMSRRFLDMITYLSLQYSRRKPRTRDRCCAASNSLCDSPTPGWVAEPVSCRCPSRTGIWRGIGSRRVAPACSAV